MYMPIIDFPSFRTYWANEATCPIIADIMSEKKYKKLIDFFMSVTI